MEFFNATSAGACLLNTTFGKDHMLAAVIARPTFRADEGQLVPTPDFSWPVGRQPAETPYGVWPADVPFLTGGIDLIVMGSLWQPGAREGAELTAEIRIGERFLRRIAVFGERRWIRVNGALVPECAGAVRFDAALL